MIDSQSAARKPKRFAQIAAAAAILLALSSTAKAQGLFPFFGGGPSPYDIERQLDAAGYALTGPLVRRGDVYLADVAVGRNRYERLVIDAETGRIVQRFRARPARWSDGPGDWGRDNFDSWDGMPRPPAGFDRPPRAEALNRSDAGEEPNMRARDQVVRGGDATKSSDLIEKSKTKAQDAKRKSATPASVAKAVNPASPAKSAGPAAVAPAAATPIPAAVTPAPVAVTPTPAPVAAAPAASPSPTPQAAKPDGSTSVATAKTPAPAETPGEHAPTKPKPVNDLPVTPLD